MGYKPLNSLNHSISNPNQSNHTHTHTHKGEIHKYVIMAYKIKAQLGVSAHSMAWGNYPRLTTMLEALRCLKNEGGMGSFYRYNEPLNHD